MWLEQNKVQIIPPSREAVESREKLLLTLNRVAEVLLTADEDDPSEALMSGMEILGRCVGADRVQIWKNELIDGELYFVMEYGWISEAGKQKVEVPPGLKIPYSAVPGWYEKLTRWEIINSRNAGMPSFDAAFLSRYEMLSVVCVPLFRDNEFIGFFSVDDCRGERTFEEDEINVFSSTGLMFASVFDRMKHDADSKKRGSLLQAVNQASGLLLDSNIESFDRTLYMAMGLVAEAVSVDRMFVFKNHLFEDELCCTQIHEWSGGAKPQQGSNMVINKRYSELMRPSTFDKISKGECVNCIVRNVPLKLQKQLVEQNIISILLVPIFIASEFWGFIGFDDCHSERIFTTEEEAILRSCGLLFVNAVIHNQMTQSIHNTTRQLEMALEQVTAASEAKGNFLSNMSHEMRTPMNAIIGMAVIGKKTEDCQEKNRALDKINEAASHLLGVINDILDMAKIEAGKMECIPAEYHFEKMLQRVLTLTRFNLDAKQQNLNLNIEKAIPVFVVGDNQRLAQAITNLLSNAIKFTGNGGKIDVDASLVSETEDSLELRISVKDNGVGIPPERLDTVFNAFEQIESELRHVQKGSGLGLPITKHIVELMGGRISLDSELGKGTTVSFTIKVGRGSRTEADDHTEALSGGYSAEGNSGEFAGKKLLLVEDIEINREIMATFLENSGLAIDFAEDGKEAVDMVTANGGKYDIILMDIQMPKMSGLEATRHIRALYPLVKLPIIALTANVFKDDIDKCLKAGMNDHLGKPFDMDKVFEILRKYLL